MTSMPKNTLVWVDQPLAVSVAAKLAGVLQTEAKNHEVKAGINWLVTTQVGTATSDSITSDIRELLPENLALQRKVGSS